MCEKEQIMHIGICAVKQCYLEFMEMLIQQCCNHLKIICEMTLFAAGEGLLEYKKELDLLFLSAELDKSNGITVEELGRKRNVKRMILVTDRREYMKSVFGMNVIGFEKKQLEEKHIKKWLTVVKKEMESSQISYRAGYQLVTVPQNEIIYVEADRDYIKLYKIGQSAPDTILKSLKALEEQLDSFCFARVHKSYLFNMQYITEVEGNKIFLYGQENAVPIGRKYKKRFMERYYDRKSWSGYGY